MRGTQVSPPPPLDLPRPLTCHVGPRCGRCTAKRRRPPSPLPRETPNNERHAQQRPPRHRHTAQQRATTVTTATSAARCQRPTTTPTLTTTTSAPTTKRTRAVKTKPPASHNPTHGHDHLHHPTNDHQRASEPTEHHHHLPFCCKTHRFAQRQRPPPLNDNQTTITTTG